MALTQENKVMLRIIQLSHRLEELERIVEDLHERPRPSEVIQWQLIGLGLCVAVPTSLLLAFKIAKCLVYCR
ncbi:small protein [Anisopteromalus calandrae negative-strand RNA virus 2]|uniref:Small protein n=1 Tax=Anisopteromalus calandrae negative-strand RNA virus 2 TaxID=2848910 RepID=A0AAE7S2C1_9MONO|nr:small protein [Anisopteromalus calandrae negative-strand RNA virus 2]QWT43290.1 small protein [Anisopteromalus calandrae negative-strand RNA virus 2]